MTNIEDFNSNSSDSQDYLEREAITIDIETSDSISSGRLDPS